MAEPPDDPGVVELLALTYGSTDYASRYQPLLTQYCADNPNARSWTWYASNSTVGDPNPYIPKAGVAVWRYSLRIPNGEVVWSNIKSQAVTENGTLSVTWGDPNDGVWQPPDRGPNGQYVAVAYWFNSDKTSAVASIPQQWANPYKGVTFQISAGALGAEPYPQILDKQFTLVYGSFVSGNYWQLRCFVGIGHGSWSFSLAPVFPPFVTFQSRPHTMTTTKYVTFDNRQYGENPTGTVLYPVIYEMNSRNLVWDGRDHDCGVPEGSRRDVSLVNDAGCVERVLYVLGFTTLKGDVLRGAWNFATYATSSAAGSPSGCYWQWTIDGPRVEYDFGNYNKTYQHTSADLRLNIYGVTYGSSDVTDIVRQQYISQTINDANNVPTKNANNWSLPVDPAHLGGDPNPGIGKVCVVIYRVAYKVGQTDGTIVGASDPAPWTPEYLSQKIQPLHTNQYPVFQDITPFRWKAARDFSTITFDLLKEDIPSWQGSQVPFGIMNPYIAAAVWSDKGVTGWVDDYVQQHPGDPVSIPVGSAGMGAYLQTPDPWYGVAKQLTILVGYAAGNNDNNHTQWKVLVDIGGANPWYFSLSRTPSSIKYPPKMPIPSDLPPVDLVWFKNKSQFDVWPQVVLDNGTVFWDGNKASAPDTWRIKPGGDKTIKLSAVTSCLENNLYSLNFSASTETYVPFTGWIRHSKLVWPQMLMTMTYGMSTLTPNRFTVLKEVRKL